MNMREKLIKKWIEEIKHESRYHVAKVEALNDEITVIDWDNKLSKTRIVIDRDRVIITGGLGCAIYVWGDKVTIPDLARFNFNYFNEKLKAIDGSKYTFEKKIAFDDLRKWKNEMKESVFTTQDLKTIYRKLRDMVNYCHSVEDWNDSLYAIEDNISDYCLDWECSLLQIGKMYDVRLYAFHQIFKMIDKQLDRKEEEVLIVK